MKKLIIIFVCCLIGFSLDLSNSEDAEADRRYSSPLFNNGKLMVKVRHYDRRCRCEKPVTGASVKAVSGSKTITLGGGSRGNYITRVIDEKKCYNVEVYPRDIGCPSKKWNTRCCSGSLGRGIKSSGRGWMVVTHYK